MNARQLEKLGVSPHCTPAAITAIRRISDSGQRVDLKGLIRAVVADPARFRTDDIWAPLAEALLADDAPAAPRDPIPFASWGDEQVDEASRQQMRTACALPMAAAAALMPDAHVGYGLPIGGVLALDGAVVPYAVGVDIACRMKLSVLDVPVAQLESSSRSERFRDALERGTRFGVGSEYATPLDHPVLDQDWTVTRVTREHFDKARRQLGTSGSGNHFVEFGRLTLETRDDQLGLDPGTYVALLSHSGSRGTGAAVCSTFSAIAQRQLPKSEAHWGRLAWLELTSAEGQEYWAAMSLMGDYAAANHDCIHRQVSKLLGGRIIAGVENHHNFAWIEVHGGREVVVHRKGATPAGAGVLGVIPGSMATPAYVVRGRGNAASLESASHGAGRCLSRTAARQRYTWRSVQHDLAKRGVQVLSAGADEVPFVYKDIEQVMAAQRELVDVVARFDPRIVKMCGDNSPAED